MIFMGTGMVQQLDITSSLDIDMLKRAYKAALWSNDLSTQNGAILLDRYQAAATSGCNNIPTHVGKDQSRLERPKKYAFTEHAERSAIYHAARIGMPTKGATLYCPWYACADCARAIISAGIVRVVGHKQMFDRTNDRWSESVAYGFEMMEEAGVETVLIDAKLDVEPIRFHEEIWYP